MEPPWVGILGQVRDLPWCWSKTGKISGLVIALERIGIDHLGKLAMDFQVLGWIGMATLVLKRMVMTKS